MYNYLEICNRLTAYWFIWRQLWINLHLLGVIRYSLSKDKVASTTGNPATRVRWGGGLWFVAPLTPSNSPPHSLQLSPSFVQPLPPLFSLSLPPSPSPSLLRPPVYDELIKMKSVKLNHSTLSLDKIILDHHWYVNNRFLRLIDLGARVNFAFGDHSDN